MEYIIQGFRVGEAKVVTSMHIKKYIQYCQTRAKEGNIIINNQIATIKVFYQYLVDEDYLDKKG